MNFIIFRDPGRKTARIPHLTLQVSNMADETRLGCIAGPGFILLTRLASNARDRLLLTRAVQSLCIDRAEDRTPSLVRDEDDQPIITLTRRELWDMGIDPDQTLQCSERDGKLIIEPVPEEEDDIFQKATGVEAGADVH